MTNHQWLREMHKAAEIHSGETIVSFGEDAKMIGLLIIFEMPQADNENIDPRKPRGLL